jgi:hypothetical protein
MNKEKHNAIQMGMQKDNKNLTNPYMYVLAWDIRCDVCRSGRKCGYAKEYTYQELPEVSEN